MAKEPSQLKLGKGTAFVKSRLKRLRQEDELWEADFQMLPKSPNQTVTQYIGLVVWDDKTTLLADMPQSGRPSVNDLARLLAEAMRRPLFGSARRPRRLHLRGHHQWRELFPHLKELGIEITVQRTLPHIQALYQDFLKSMRDVHQTARPQPNTKQAAVEALFPAVAKWVRDYGHIEIGEHESYGFAVRALSYGNLVFEDDRPCSLAEAMALLDKGLADYFEEEDL